MIFIFSEISQFDVIAASNAIIVHEKLGFLSGVTAGIGTTGFLCVVIIILTKM